MLVEAIRFEDCPRAWEELDTRCRPIMRGGARRMGLDEALAEDAAQTAMIRLAESIRANHFDRARGSVRALCLAMVRSQVIDVMRKRARDCRADASQAQREPPAGGDLERIWMDERRRQILRLALAELREGGTDERTIHAFELYGLREMAPERVGEMLGMTREEVYVAKFRVAKRLRPIVARLDEAYEDL